MSKIIFKDKKEEDIFLLKTISLAKKYGFRIRNQQGFLNIIGVRNESRRSDKWDDFIVAFRWINEKLEGYIFEGTTDPGAYYLLNPIRALGTAILCPNIQVHDHYRLMDNGHNGYRAYKQVKPFPHIRDNDKNTLLNFDLFNDKTKWITNERIGSNLHRAHQNLILNTIGKYSAGCQVVRKPKDWDLLVKLGDEQIQMTGVATFDYGILWMSEILNENI